MSSNHGNNNNGHCDDQSSERQQHHQQHHQQHQQQHQQQQQQQQQQQHLDAANKRAALAGQWRTPPTPAFPAGFSSHQQQQQQQHSQQQHSQQQHSQQQHSQQQLQSAQPTPQTRHHAPPGTSSHTSEQQQQQQQQIQHHPSNPTDQLPSLPPPQSIPDNSADYAKALQEAYRKGAEAAAMLAQQQQHQQNIPTAASCPNFSITSSHMCPTTTTTTSIQPMSGVTMEESAYAASTGSSSSSMHPQMVPTQSVMPDPLTSSMPPPPPTQSISSHPAPSTTTAAPPHAGVPPPQHYGQQQQQQHQPPPPSSLSSSSLHSHPSQPPPPQQQQQQQHPSGRSLSLPDMSAYAAQAEEEKRQKRLARNRASARLRRLRKKNLVDAYETEVGILEKTLKQLQAHEWGNDDNHAALLDALGMERGQQAISPEQRSGMIRDILSQQMQQVELLRQSQVEQEFLAMLAQRIDSRKDDDDEEDDDLIKELEQTLQLTDIQKQELLVASKGLDREVEALDTVAASLQAMQENDWLLNEGVQNITDQFTSILHKNQLSKFLLWTDANVDAIDQLDHVQVQPLQTAPIFTFGVETTPVDDEDK